MSGFFSWIEQGGSYVAGFAVFISSITAAIFGLVKIYNHAMKPVHDAKRSAEEGDAELHERIDTLEKESKQCAKKFANDDEAIKSLRREQNRQADMLSMLVDGMFLIIQHDVTNDHVPDMEEWMRNYAKNSVKSDMSS